MFRYKAECHQPGNRPLLFRKLRQVYVGKFHIPVYDNITLSVEVAFYPLYGLYLMTIFPASADML